MEGFDNPLLAALTPQRFVDFIELGWERVEYGAGGVWFSKVCGEYSFRIIRDTFMHNMECQKGKIISYCSVDVDVMMESDTRFDILLNEAMNQLKEAVERKQKELNLL